MTLALTGTALTGAEALGGAAVNALIRKIESEIANFGWGDLDKIIGRYLPGKRNKAKRKVVRKQLTNNSSSMAAVSQNIRVGRAAPRFRSTRGRYVVGNREFVGDVRGSTSFRLEEFTIQPGLTAVFPWLAQIAPTHQKYKINNLKFCYVPIAPTTAQGRVTMAYAVDPLDPKVRDKQELFQYPTSTETSVWAANSISCVGATTKTLFTRSGAVTNTDLKTYDAGKFLVAASNNADDSIIGELFVEYEVELITPKPAKCPASITTFQGDLPNPNFFEPFQNLMPINATGGDWFFYIGAGVGAPLMGFRSIGEYLVVIRNRAQTTSAGINLVPKFPDDNNVEIDLQAATLPGSGQVVAIVTIKSRQGSDGVATSVKLQPGSVELDTTEIEILVTRFNSLDAQTITA